MIVTAFTVGTASTLIAAALFGAHLPAARSKPASRCPC
jgi:hypothetical protein